MSEPIILPVNLDPVLEMVARCKEAEGLEGKIRAAYEGLYALDDKTRFEAQYMIVRAMGGEMASRVLHGMGVPGHWLIDRTAYNAWMDKGR